MAVGSKVILRHIANGVNGSQKEMFNLWRFHATEEGLKLGFESKYPGDSEVGEDEHRARAGKREILHEDILIEVVT